MIDASSFFFDARIETGLSSMNMVVVCNPVSGRGRAIELAREFEALAKLRGHRVSFVATKSAEEMAGIGGLISEEVDVVVCAGGDGTLNALVNGMDDPGQVPIAQLATGTANLLARELGLPSEAGAVLSMIEAGRTVEFDVMVINESTRALLVVSVGFDAMVIEAIHRNRKGVLGFRGYARPILSVMRGYMPPRLRVWIEDGEEVWEGGLVVVGNVRRYAAFFSITDQARFDSGMLDVCIFPDASRMGLIGLLPAARRGTLSESGRVKCRNAKRVRIESACEDGSEVAVEVDGEYFGRTPIEIGVLAGAARVVAP